MFLHHLYILGFSFDAISEGGAVFFFSPCLFNHHYFFLCLFQTNWKHKVLHFLWVKWLFFHPQNQIKKPKFFLKFIYLVYWPKWRHQWPVSLFIVTTMLWPVGFWLGGLSHNADFFFAMNRMLTCVLTVCRICSSVEKQWKDFHRIFLDAFLVLASKIPDFPQ